MIEMKKQEHICPGCDQPVESVADSCEMCGLDFYLASRLIQNAFGKHKFGVTGMLVSVQPRIGEFLIAQKLLTSEQLAIALKEQRHQLAQGEHTPLGKILSDLGFIDQKTFEYYMALQVLQLKLQLVVGRINLAAATDRPDMVSRPIQEMKQNLLQFAATVNGSGVK